jgi:signal transduction histidine kinase
LGVQSSAVLGKPIFEVFPHKRGTEVEQHFRTVAQTKRPIVFTALSPSALRSFEYRVFPSDEGVSVFFHDNTDRLRVEAEIRLLNESLEQRVLDRTAQLDGFCHSIAHDMRMHIRGVSTNAAMLVEDIEHGQINLRPRLERLNQSTQQMANLVNGLLAFARNTAKTVEKASVDLSAEAALIVDRLRTDEEYARDVIFNINPNLDAKADRQLASVVLHNLLDNACKYRKSGVDATVEVGELESHGERVFFVRDNGIGFDEAYAERIFKPFERLHGDLSVPGSGIGLANAKRILQRHGGAIWAESQPGAGSTFYFTFESNDVANLATVGTDPVTKLHRTKQMDRRL